MVGVTSHFIQLSLILGRTQQGAGYHYTATLRRTPIFMSFLLFLGGSLNVW